MYPYWSALEDAELMTALGYSALRQGRKIQVPPSRTKQKIIIKSQDIVTKASMFKAS